MFLWEGAYYGLFAAVIGSIAGYICTIFVEAATTDTIQLAAVPFCSNDRSNGLCNFSLLVGNVYSIEKNQQNEYCGFYQSG